MNSIDSELDKHGIKILCPIDQFNINEIATYVATLLCNKFPSLGLDYLSTFRRISNLNMYIADMPYGMSDACYYYKNTSMYFRSGLSFDEIKRLSFHESIHHLQEVRDNKNELHKLGLCTYLHSKAYGSALNESSVQLMASYATCESADVVKYYDISFPTDSPNYYPLLCNLIKQIGYLTGYPVLFESTIYANDSFFKSFKKLLGDNTAYNIQQGFDKILLTEEKIIKLNNKLQSTDMSDSKFKYYSSLITKCKKQIKTLFFNIQNLIITSFFDSKIKTIQNTAQIEQFRRCLYNYSSLIGSSSDYTFFNDYYISKMVQLDELYDNFANNRSIAVVRHSRISVLMKFLKKMFTRDEIINYNELK